MKRMILHMAMISFLLLWASACSSHRPVLSSNEHLARVGPSVAEGDVDACIRRAEAVSNERGDTSKEGVVAGTATNTAVGAAAGGAGGAVFGRAGRGAAAGAAGGAVGSLAHALVQGLFTSNKAPDVSRRAFVDRCLREKGYDLAGWK
jgi:outer membrane lipoprotein SlyB